MTEQLIDIGRRLSALREIMGISAAELARKCGITPEELAEYEQGARDFSFSFLYNAARTLGVDVVDLMSGDSPKLSACCLTRAGQGYEIDRRRAYSYKHLAFTFRNKLGEPFMVTVEPKSDTDAPEQHSHAGQEFNLMLEGRMKLYMGDLAYELNPGDSVYFDASNAHAMRALDGKPARFLAVVMQKEE
ncbi:MAG: XRE family transcriptional regulator [Oscillospiraceae bacterium]|nr:XRE family transcriptional regulator [Oscillospiraceae bacterium]